MYGNWYSMNVLTCHRCCFDSICEAVCLWSSWFSQQSPSPPRGADSTSYKVEPGPSWPPYAHATTRRGEKNWLGRTEFHWNGERSFILLKKVALRGSPFKHKNILKFSWETSCWSGWDVIEESNFILHVPTVHTGLHVCLTLLSKVLSRTKPNSWSLTKLRSFFPALMMVTMTSWRMASSGSWERTFKNSDWTIKRNNKDM